MKKIVGGRIFVVGIGRAKEQGFDSQGAFEQAIDSFEFGSDLPVGGGGGIEMEVGVIADFVALGINAFEKIGETVGVFADYKEDGGDMMGFKKVEDLGSVSFVRAIIERENYFFWKSCPNGGDCWMIGGRKALLHQRSGSVMKEV